MSLFPTIGTANTHVPTGFKGDISAHPSKRVRIYPFGPTIPNGSRQSVGINGIHFDKALTAPSSGQTPQRVSSFVTMATDLD
jgi:hypothetical protein